MEKNILRRNQSLDLIKIFAMIGVMGLHSTLGQTETFMGFLISRIFGISVPLFFMVSGYLLSMKNVDWKYSRRNIIGIARFCFLFSLISLIVKIGMRNIVMVDKPEKTPVISVLELTRVPVKKKNPAKI